jgi:hypothetical protein
LKVDGLCYGKTLAAIRRFQKEACGFKWPDGRISPGGKTHARLREFFIPANPYTMPRIYQMLPQALLWILAAKRVLGLAELHLRGQQGFSKPTRPLLRARGQQLGRNRGPQLPPAAQLLPTDSAPGDPNSGLL